MHTTTSRTHRATASLCTLALTLLTTAIVASPAAGQEDPEGLRKYIDRLNAPILQVSRNQRAAEIYFEAYQVIDSADPRAASALVVDQPFNPYVAGYDEAIQWAGEPGQQEAIDLILDTNAAGFNATQRQLFGLPYGYEQTSEDMAIFDFVAAWSGRDANWLWSLNFEYMLPYKELAGLLRAEAYRRATEGDTDGGVEAMLGMARMWRQLMNRPTAYEKTTGFELLREAMPEIRNFMWVFRDSLTVENFETIALELERLDLTRVDLPTFEQLAAEQLIQELYGSDNRPKMGEFALQLSRAQSVRRPLRRFSAAAALAHSLAIEVPKRDQETALKDVMGDWELRWRLPLHDTVSSDTDYEKLKSDFQKRHSIVEAVMEDIPTLFGMRIPLTTEVNGTATASGIHAYIRNERGQLVPGEDASLAIVPQKLAQVQPSFVQRESSLYDHYAGQGTKFIFAVIRNTDPRFAFGGFTVNTVTGPVVLREYWPLMYSVGPNGREDLDKTIKHVHLPTPEEVGDIVYFPNIEMMQAEK